MNYIDAMYELSLQCIQLGEIEEAAKWIEKRHHCRKER